MVLTIIVAKAQIFEQVEQMTSFIKEQMWIPDLGRKLATNIQLTEGPRRAAAMIGNLKRVRRSLLVYRIME